MESNKKSYFTTEKDKELLKTDFLKGLDARMSLIIWVSMILNWTTIQALTAQGVDITYLYII